MTAVSLSLSLFLSAVAEAARDERGSSSPSDPGRGREDALQVGGQLMETVRNTTVVLMRERMQPLFGRMKKQKTKTRLLHNCSTVSWSATLSHPPAVVFISRAEFLSLLRTYNCFLKDQTQLRLSFSQVCPRCTFNTFCFCLTSTHFLIPVRHLSHLNFTFGVLRGDTPGQQSKD